MCPGVYIHPGDEGHATVWLLMITQHSFLMIKIKQGSGAQFFHFI